MREQTFGELNDSHNNKQNELETALQNKNVRQRTTDRSTTSKDQSTRTTTKHTNSNTSIRNRSPQTSENVDLTSKTSTVDQSSLMTIKDQHVPAGQDSSQPNTSVQSQSNQEEKEDSRIGSGQTKDENGNGLQKLLSLLNAVADANKQKASTQLSSVNTRESSPELEHPHFLHSSEENTKGHITTPKKQALAVSGQISSPVIPQAACTVRGGAKQITKSLQKLLTKVRPTQLRQTQRYAVHPELAIRLSNPLPRNTFLRRLPCIYMAPYTRFGRNVLNSVPSLFYHSLRPLYVLSDASQYYRKAADNPPSKTTSSSSGTGQAASQGGGQGNSGAQGGGTGTSSGGNGASGSGNGGDDRDKKDRKPRDRKPSSDLEEDVEEVESKEGDEENEVQGDGNTSGNFDSGLGMQVEESPFVEARAEKTEHRAQAHHWCLSGGYKFIGFVTIPRIPTTSTTRPDPMDIPVFQHFHGKVSPSVTQQPPYSLAHSPPTSSRSPSPTHSSDSGITEPERFDELVTGVQHHNDAEEPSSQVEEETRPPSNLDQVQSTLFRFVAHSSENNGADLISAADDEDTNDDEQNDVSREPDTVNWLLMSKLANRGMTSDNFPLSYRVKSALSSPTSYDVPLPKVVTELVGEGQQVLVEGPPGTGKTFVGMHVAEQLKSLGTYKFVICLDIEKASKEVLDSEERLVKFSVRERLITLDQEHTFLEALKNEPNSIAFIFDHLEQLSTTSENAYLKQLICGYAVPGGRLLLSRYPYPEIGSSSVHMVLKGFDSVTTACLFVQEKLKVTHKINRTQPLEQYIQVHPIIGEVCIIPRMAEILVRVYARDNRCIKDTETLLFHKMIMEWIKLRLPRLTVDSLYKLPTEQKE